MNTFTESFSVADVLDIPFFMLYVIQQSILRTKGQFEGRFYIAKATRARQDQYFNTAERTLAASAERFINRVVTKMYKIFVLTFLRTKWKVTLQ